MSKYQLELTLEEVLYLQKELEFEGGYQWLGDIFKGLQDKVNALYHPPEMTEKELEMKVQKIMDNCKWDKSIVPFMKHSEEYELRFFNNVVPGECYEK